MYKYNTKILDNGLKIAAHHMPHMKSCALGVWIAAGGRYESVRSRGISHFVEHILFKGTKNRTTTQIKNTIEGIGGSLNGFTSEEVTCYLVKITGRHVSLALDVLSDMVLNAKFEPRHIDRERSVILEEIKMYKDQPDQYVNELLGELMWPKQTLGIPLIGTFRTVNAFTRKDLLEYRNKWYNPSNITIVACGSVDWDLLVRDCENIFSRKKGFRTPPHKNMNVSRRGPKTKILNKETEQAHIAIGFHGISRQDPARYAMDMMNIILGANMSSRLFHELREKRGLAYAISSHVGYFADGGSAAIEAGVDNKKISEAIRLILKELSKIRKGPVTKKEFERAKEYYHGHLSFVLEDTTDHMLWLGKKIVTKDEPIDAMKILNRIKKVGMDDVIRVAAETFRKKNLSIAAIGPISDKEEKAIAAIAEEL